MTESDKTKTRLASWATPTAEDEAAWAAMTRDEQLEALQILAHDPDTSSPSGKSAAQILAETRGRRRERNG